MSKDERIKQYRMRKYIEFMETCSNIVPVETLDKLGFFTAPASTKYHGAYEGGLFDHSLETARALVELTDRLDLKWVKPESPYIVGMYHDLCKCDNYVKDFETDKYTYNPEIIIPGHGDKSVIMLSLFIALINLILGRFGK